jgi:hypothetical protein
MLTNNQKMYPTTKTSYYQTPYYSNRTNRQKYDLLQLCLYAHKKRVCPHAAAAEQCHFLL